MPNGCHNKPERTPAYYAQDGWVYEWRNAVLLPQYDDGLPVRTRFPRLVEVLDRGSPGCGHPARASDSGCEGCRWR